MEKGDPTLNKMCILIMIALSMLGRAVAQVPAGADWHLVKEGEGIQVYTAPAGNSGRKFIKVSAELTGSLQSVAAVFRDIDRQKAWVYGTGKSYLVQKEDDNNLLYYNETNLPWPVSNRDVVIRMRMEENPAERSLSILQEASSGKVPVSKGIVRVSHLWGRWLFREEKAGSLRVEYYLDVDPAGSLPVWVTNLFISKGPYQTLVKLRKQVGDPQKGAATSR